MAKKHRQSQFHRSQIGRAQRFIRLHLDRDLTLTEIAKVAGSSSYHFARLFLAYTGETPFDFLRRLRLLAAATMLQEDAEAPVTEIALDVGYETPSSFNKAFKNQLQMNPSDFRGRDRREQNDLIH